MKLGDHALVEFLIDLVDHKQERTSSSPEHLGKFLVEQGEAGTTIHHKKQKVCTRDCRLRGRVSRLGKIGIGCIPDAASINDLEGEGSLAADPSKAVSCDSRLVMDDGKAPAHQAVKERRLAHIGATDDSDASHSFSESDFTGWVWPPA